MRKPVHPGKVFLEDVLKPLGVSVEQSAMQLGVSNETLRDFVSGKASLTPSLALCIAKATGTTAESWLSMQMKLDLFDARANEAADVATVESNCLAVPY